MDKVWYKSKTILLSLMLTLIGVADTVGAIDLTPILVMVGVPAERAPGIVMICTIAFAILRTVTSGAVTMKKDDA